MGFFSSAPEIIGDVSPDQIVEIFKTDGFAAEIAALSSGRPFVRFKVDGYNSSIYFYSETEGKPGFYRSIQFSTGFRDKLSLDKANQWNRERRFIKVYADTDGELAFDLDIALDGGVTKKFLLERIADWRSLFSSVLAFVSK
ncbi:MAG: YbjN domain-containing protein [Burkholderiales bacterium]|nr:YbjN domain-containing protein [Burkholderiales bacterium]